MRFREIFSSTEVDGLNASPPMDLRIDKGISVGYERGSIVHKFYDSTNLPSEIGISNDILVLSREYLEFCSREYAWKYTISWRLQKSN